MQKRKGHSKAMAMEVDSVPDVLVATPQLETPSEHRSLDDSNNMLTTVPRNDDMM